MHFILELLLWLVCSLFKMLQLNLNYCSPKKHIFPLLAFSSLAFIHLQTHFKILFCLFKTQHFCIIWTNAPLRTATLPEVSRPDAFKDSENTMRAQRWDNFNPKNRAPTFDESSAPELVLPFLHNGLHFTNTHTHCEAQPAGIPTLMGIFSFNLFFF